MADLQRVIKVGILTVSDSCYNGKAEDKSGENLKSLVECGNCFKGTVATKDIIHDVAEDIKAKLIHWSDSLKLDVILTTGGTGFSPRDVTPEATKAIIDKEALGMTVAMIKGSLDITPLAMLSRLVCGIRGNTLIVNLPGSTKGSAECLQIVARTIPHAVDLLHSDRSSIETTHSALQSEGIKSVTSTGDLSRGGCESVKSKPSSAPHLLQQLQFDRQQQSKLVKNCLTEFCNKLKNCFEQLVKETAPSNFNFIDCHINDGNDESDQWINLITKFMQVLVFAMEDFAQKLGHSQQFNTVSLSTQISKAFESKMKSWIEGCHQEPFDQSFPPFLPESMQGNLSKSASGCMNETDTTKLFTSQGDTKNTFSHFLHHRSMPHPSCQIESEACQSSSHIGNSKRMKKHTLSSYETDLYCKRNENMSLACSGSFAVSNSYKTFHPSHVKDSRLSDSSRNRTWNGTSPLPNHAVSKTIKSLQKKACQPVQNDILMGSKQTQDNFLSREGEHFFSPTISVEPTKENNMNDSPRIPHTLYSRESCELVSSSSQCGENCSRSYENHAIDKHSFPDKYLVSCPRERGKNHDFVEKASELMNNDSNALINRSQLSNVAMKNYSTSSISSSTNSSSGPLLLSSSKSLKEKRPVVVNSTKPQTSGEHKPQIPNNIMSAKIHNIHNQGELVNVPVGKAFNCFVNDHRLLKGISLYKGKRDIKKLLVYMSRQEDVTGQEATSWKRGKEVLERNRLDDYFQLTHEGMEEQQQVLCGRKRDQYVVNWYMWCPGHGNCKRKCGGFGKCIENCKGMLHKQDRHNCSLMVNLKLFLSDLSTWRVHITGSHLPEQATETAMTVSLSAQDGGQLQPEFCVEGTMNSSPCYTFSDSSKNDNKEQSLSGDTPAALAETIIETHSYSSNVSSNINGKITNVFFENDHDLQQSKIPSKKRISKMLSSLKRRRQNKPYCLIKSRPTNSNSSHDIGNDSSKSVSSPKSHNENLIDEYKHSLPGNDDTTHECVKSETIPTLTAPCNQNSLLNELSSYLPVGCSNENDHETEALLTAGCLLSIDNSKSNSITPKPSSCVVSTPSYTCHTTTTKCTDSLTDYIAAHHELPVNLETTNFSQEDVDIYHSAISLPNFHQPFLHANSLTDILTEAGVNISEQFDEFNSSINLGNDSTSLPGIDHREDSISESLFPFQPSHQVTSQQSCSSLVTNEPSNVMISHGLHTNTACVKTAQSPSRR